MTQPYLNNYHLHDNQNSEKMKLFFLIVVMSFVVLSCENDDFIYSFPEVDKLLVSVTRTYDGSVFSAEFKYDSLNRVVEVKNIFPESQTTVESYIYDEAGRVVEKRIGNYTTTYFYNSDGKLIEQNMHYLSPNDEHEWNQKTEFRYKNGQIFKGLEYSQEGELISNFSYKYDSKGNTLEKIVRPAGNESDFTLIEIKFRYDNYINPLGENRINMLNGYTFTQHPDIVQLNNPSYSSYMNAVSSSFPPEFEISYEYDSSGLPVKGNMTNVRFSDHKKATLEYEYMEIED